MAVADSMSGEHIGAYRTQLAGQARAEVLALSDLG